VLSSETHTRAGSSKQRQLHSGPQNSKATFPVQAERVSEHVIQLLRGECVPSSQLSRPLTLTAYTALLPTIWSLLNNPSAGQRHLSDDVLQAVVEHAIKTSSKSATKRATVEFVGRLVFVHKFLFPQVSCCTDFSLNDLGLALAGNGTCVPWDFQGGETPGIGCHVGGVDKSSPKNVMGTRIKRLVLHRGKRFIRMVFYQGSLIQKNLRTNKTILRFLLRLFQRKSCLATTEVDHQSFSSSAFFD
jgi:hypothetical protein